MPICLAPSLLRVLRYVWFCARCPACKQWVVTETMKSFSCRGLDMLPMLFARRIRKKLILNRVMAVRWVPQSALWPEIALRNLSGC